MRWLTDDPVRCSIQGYANFICMVDAEKGAPIRERVQAILVKHGWSHEIRHPKKLPPAAEEAVPESIARHQKGKSVWEKIRSIWKK